MMPVTDRAQTLTKTVRATRQPALRPVGLKETALIAVLAAALGLATAALLPPDLVPSSGAMTQDSDRGR